MVFRSFSLPPTDHTLENKQPLEVLRTPWCVLGDPERLSMSQGTDTITGHVGGLLALTDCKGPLEKLGR